MKKRSKRGASHVEFVLSFMIFVVFLIFLYNGLEPIVQSAGSKQFVLGHLKLALVENLTLSDFTIQTFTINLEGINLADKECIRIHEGQLWDLIKVDQEDSNLTIKNAGEEILNYSWASGTNRLLIGPGNKIGNLLKVFFASDFTNRSPELEISGGSGTCERLYECDDTRTTGCYDLKKITTREIIASTNIFDIKGWYEDNYDALKYDLGVPSGSDWNFEFQTIEFIDASGEIIRPDNFMVPPENTNVYVGEFPIQYIDEEATTQIGFIRITVW